MTVAQKCKYMADFRVQLGLVRKRVKQETCIVKTWEGGPGLV